MNSTIQVRVNPKTKQAVTKIFEELGLDISSGVKMYFSQVILHRGVPFPLLTENGYTLEQEAKLLAIAKETEDDYKSGRRKAHTSVKAMIKEIMST